MSLLPKLQILSQDTELYATVTVKDATGVYNVSTNPGGFGAPNPATGDVVKIMLGAEYFGSTGSTPVFETVPMVEILGAGTVWTHGFKEGVTRLIYLVGIAVGGSFTGLKGNLQFTLTNANTLLAGAHYIEIEGIVYKLDVSKGLTTAGGWVTTPFTQDHLAVVGGIQYFEGQAYTMWNYQGKAALVQEISAIACTSLQCGALGLDLVMARYRFYLASGYEFAKGNYSKAHNLAIALSPELTTTNCPTC